MPNPPLSSPLHAAAARDLAGGQAQAAHDRLSAHAARGGVLDARAEWLLAQASRRIGHDGDETAALARLLTLEPRNIAALLAMADAKQRGGDQRAQLAFLRTALAQAAATPPPPQLHALLNAAQVAVRNAQAAFAAHIDATGSALGLTRNDASPVLRHALDLLHGRSDLYLQQPSMFYYPGLPQRPFFDRADFAWVPALEAQTAALCAELEAVIAADAPFAPYVGHDPDRPAPANPLLGDPAWGAAYLWRGGEPVAAIADHAPQTMAALAAVPMPVIAGRSPMALWSRLRPGTHIAPHHGLLNTRLICHLPLIVPDGCALRVGHETREWRTGKLTIFDDSFEHEAWNRGASDRTVLLFEIWRPEIPEDERPLLARLFEAIAEVDPPAPGADA
jgi:aspartyl/asparaginyl beta-hydroxylase (cupin superfamily)